MTHKKQTNEQKLALALDKYKPQIQMALPRSMTAERMRSVALTEMRKNPKLKECDPISFLGAIIQCAQLGLEPGALGHAYLIPFRNKKKQIVECNFIPGYRGLIELARRSGEILSISAQVVYENDHFDYEYGLDERLVHRPSTGDRGEMSHVYAIAKLKDGGHQFEVMTKADVEKIRDMKEYQNQVWKDHFDEMARKTAVRRLFKYLPVSVELKRVAEFDELAEQGKNQGNRAIIDAEYTVEHNSEYETNIALENKLGQEKHDKETKEKALKAVETMIADLLKNNHKESTLLTMLNIKNFDEINSFSSDKINSIIEVLIDYQKNKNG